MCSVSSFVESQERRGSPFFNSSELPLVTNHSSCELEACSMSPVFVFYNTANLHACSLLNIVTAIPVPANSQQPSMRPKTR